MTGIVIETSREAASEVHLGDLPRARALMEEALALAREHELNRWLPGTLIGVADVEIAEGRLDQARAHCEEALTLAPGGFPSLGVVVPITSPTSPTSSAATRTPPSLPRTLSTGALRSDTSMAQRPQH